MNTYKPLSPKSIRSPRQLALILRAKPQKPDIGAILRQEALSSVISSSNNTLSYYSTSPTRNVLSPKPIKPTEMSFKSVHRSPESKETQILLEKLNGPTFNPREKKALKEIRKKQGRIHLLSDLYQEFTKDLGEKSVEELILPQKKTGRLEEQENTRLVEDLDKWERELMNKHPVSPKATFKKSAIPGLVSDKQMSPIKIIQQSPLRKPSVNKSLIASIEDIAQRESVNKNQKVVEAERSQISEPKSLDKFGEGDEKEIEDIEVDQTDESLQELKENILGLSGKELETDRIHRDNTRGMTMHQISDYYKELGQGQESQIEVKLQKNREIVKEQQEIMFDLRKDNEMLERKTKQLSKHLELIEEARRERKQFGGARKGRKLVKKTSEELVPEEHKPYDYDSEDENNPENVKKRELKQNLEVLTERLERNTADLAEAENAVKVAQQKIRGLVLTKVALYRKILLRGMDIRDEGLIWAVKGIIEAGEQVVIADFPIFLDYKSRKFILDKEKAQRELKQLNMIEKASMEVFKASRDALFENDTRFSSLFNSDFRNVMIDGNGASSPTEAGSKIYLNTSGEYRASGMQSPVYTDDTMYSNERIPTKTSQRMDSDEAVSSQVKKSWVKGDQKTDEKHSRKTENEEIYLKAREMLKGMYKNEEDKKERIREKRSPTNLNPIKKIKKIDYENIDDHVKLYHDNIFVNNYKSRKEFVMKMRSIGIEYRIRQAKIAEESEKEAVRIITEYGTNILDKQVDLDVYLMSMFGPYEATKYLNKLGMGEKAVL